MKPRAPSPRATRAPLLRDRRAYQAEALRALRERGFFCLLWRRQAGKSTTLSEAAISVMLANPGSTTIYASASLLLGREIIYKESQVMAGVFRALLDRQAEAVDARTGKALPGLASDAGLDPDALADCFESQRLEFRVRHDRSTVSRTQVIAPNPATARGWTGWVLLDEFGFIRDFRDLWEAVEPVVSTDPDFHLLMATTPPADDAHYSYELTAPPGGMVFPVNPSGNWYESEARVPVHRVDIFDAHAAGVKLYDLRTRRELTPEEHFAAADDKDAWRRNYKVEHVPGGTSACSLLALDTAQRRGVGQCACFLVDGDADFDRALAWLEGRLGSEGGPVAIGLDPATTEKETSNPTALAVAEQRGVEVMFRLVVVWKTSDPAVATGRVRAVVEALARHRRRPRRLCVDASNERLWAAALRRDLRALVPVDLVVATERIDRPGHPPMSAKEYLGSRLVAELEDNHLWLPPERYVREDWRLVRRERGSFVCVPDRLGRHGDTFDAAKLALHGLRAWASGLPLLFQAPQPFSVFSR